MNRLCLSKLFSCYAVLLFLFTAVIPTIGQGIATVELAKPINIRSLSGHIQAPDFEALDNAQVELCDVKTGKVLTSTNTDAHGNFYFKGFGKSEYKVRVTSPGFDPLVATLRIRKNGRQRAILTLILAT